MNRFGDAVVTIERAGCVQDEDLNVPCVPTRRMIFKSYFENIKERKFAYGEILETRFPTVLERILSFLSISDLRICEEVNRAWRTAAKHVRQCRSNLVKESPTFYATEHESVVSYSLLYSDEFQAAIVFYGYVQLNHSGVINCCSHDERGGKDLLKCGTYFHDNFFGNDIPYFIITSNRTWMVRNGLRIPDPVYSGVLLPRIPGIRIVLRKTYYRNVKRDVLKTVMDHEIVRGVLNFPLLYDHAVTGVKQMVDALNSRPIQSNKMLAFGGGVLQTIPSNVKVGPKVCERNFFCYIAFLQDSAEPENSFRAYSFVAMETSLPSLDTELKNFHRKCDLKQHSIVFKFSCYAREVIEDEEVIIRKYFKNSLLVGANVFGEIGHNTATAQNFSANLNEIAVIGYSTILVVITWL